MFFLLSLTIIFHREKYEDYKKGIKIIFEAEIESIKYDIKNLVITLYISKKNESNFIELKFFQ
jgi:hypothetical protein